MKFIFNYLRYAPVIVVLLLMTPTLSGSTTLSQPTLLIEIVYQSSHPSIPISETVRVYDDGRCITEGVFVEKAKSGRDRKVFEKLEKQLDPSELAELVGWTEQSDFRNAQQEYAVTIVVDYPDWFLVTRHNNNSQKSIKVLNFDRGNEAQRAKIPLSVFNLLKWARPYDFTR